VTARHRLCTFAASFAAAGIAIVCLGPLVGAFDDFGARAAPLPTKRPVLAKPHAAKARVPQHLTSQVPLPRRRPDVAPVVALAYAATAGLPPGLLARPDDTPRATTRPSPKPFAPATTSSTPRDDVAAVKRVIELSRKGKDAAANDEMAGIHDPVARKLAEWAYLRSDGTNPGFERFARFIAANPSWPHIPLFRRRAENALWDDRVDDATVRAFFSHRAPTTAKGRLVLARALLAEGDRAGAEALVRKAWRDDDFSAAVERIALEKLGSLLTREDFRIRMERRLYADDAPAGLRAAEHLGGDDLAVARARAAVIERSQNAKALLDAVPRADRDEPGYIFSKAVWLRRSGQVDEAAKLMLTAPMDAAKLVDLDQWWIERRLLVRKLLDEGDYKTAYRIARDTPSPPKGNYRVDQFFTAGWIALRYLHDPATAASHFAHMAIGTNNPHALSRAGYWQGRAAEALGRKAEARSFYFAAAHHSTTYYGQLARARLGMTELGLREVPRLASYTHAEPGDLEIVRAVDILYSIDERDLVASIFAELGESGTDVAGMVALCETARHHHDGRAMLLLASAAVSRGFPLDSYAFPTIGLPSFKQIAPPIEPAIAYSIARQESHFNQKVVSPAHAMGLMQVTPEAAIDTAKKFKVHYDKARLLSDPVYNMQMGAAELSNLIHGYRGSYILTFAGYNAGRGRVRQWIATLGDPRDPNVDPIDWVERIPISETRNYVQRVMENLQIYRARFGGGPRLMIEADLRRDLQASAAE
jgi:soluble lytic murein transglycosylase